MTSVVDALRFRWPWREYQARVLDALEAHMADRRLHVVAAPGSGKTVLGLEVFRRLGQPALVLSPTRTIRDQWVERLRDFLPGDDDPFALPWCSRNLGALAFFNSLTYQSLHTRMRQAAAAAEDAEDADEDEDEGEPSGEEIGEVAALLKAAGIRVLILDEAHHLRAEWWAALQAIVEQLDEVTLVSLTATPPYGTIDQEWNRYLALCGPIGEEISVPELVKAGTLCPHQDYVWLAPSDGAETQRLRVHRGRVIALLNELLVDPDLLADCRAHAWVNAPQAHPGELVDAPHAAMALCVFLQRAGTPASALMQAADLSADDLPSLGVGEWEHLLRWYLFGNGWPDTAECRERRRLLARRLRAEELLHGRELALLDPGRHWPRVALGAGKVDACVAVHQLEHEVRGDALRQLILTDYIRDEQYASTVPAALGLGAWPVFLRLAGGGARVPARALALHTGRLSVVHRDLLAPLRALPECPPLQVHEVPAHWDFVEVRAQGDTRLTRALTRLLVDGQVQVLVGTRALLGEGWDAPPVNSLVLASVTGSFVTTNQMRGRAIRTDTAQPDKIASIWHLGAFAELAAGHLDLRDLRDMRARFETFVGLAHDRPVIEGGLERLHPGFLTQGRFPGDIHAEALNRRMAERLREHGDLPRRWHAAIDHSDLGRVLPSVDVRKPPRFRPLDFRGTLLALVWRLLAAALMVLAVLVEALYGRFSVATFVPLAVVIAGLLLFLMAPRSLRLLRLYLNHLPVDGAVRGIALAVRDALCATGLLPAEIARSPLIVHTQLDGNVQITLGAGSFAERALFADCLGEVLAPIERPRYLITRRLARHVGREQDYHAVPALLGARAERARAFLDAWRRRVSDGELLYTRTEEGRRTLVRARLRAFATAAEHATRRMDRWL